MKFENSRDFAEKCDSEDPLKHFREKFYIPKYNDRDLIYFCGNSLGLQPRSTKSYIIEQLDNWQNLAVEGWFEGDSPWMFYHRELQSLTAPVVGAKPSEVIPMNTLTVNLHLLMVSFFRPNGKRRKVMMEAGAFPSDQYAVESQLRFHGLDIENDLIEVSPREGEETLRTSDIIDKINAHGDELALILFGGINYYTGQLFDMQSICMAGHKVGAIVGFDLAHAAGNVPMHLHDWQVDFACWCSYKYMNSGPGGISGAFIHEKHFNSPVNRFAGWWGYDTKERFKMDKGFVPEMGAEGWQISCSPVLTLAAHKAALQLFKEVGGMGALREKSIKLTSYLEFMIRNVNRHLKEELFEIITPINPDERGAQLSVVAQRDGHNIFDKLVQAGIQCDWREPDVIRISPAPFYNTFTDIYILSDSLIRIATEV